MREVGLRVQLRGNRLRELGLRVLLTEVPRMTRASVYTSRRGAAGVEPWCTPHGGALRESSFGVHLTRPCFVTCDHVGRIVSKKPQVDCLLVFSVI